MGETQKGLKLKINFSAIKQEKEHPNNADKYTRSSDDEEFRYISLSYAFSHPVINKETSCANSTTATQEEFEFGITSGSAWYPLVGKIFFKLKWGNARGHRPNTATYRESKRCYLIQYISLNDKLICCRWDARL